MTTPGTGWPREQFWLNTWRAWRSGTLAALLPGTVRDAAMDFQTFVSTCDAVQHPAFPVVLAGKALAPDEFLIGYDLRR